MMGYSTKQRGVSLIEVMVGMTIGLIILTLSYQIFISNKATHNRILAQSRLQENARFAFGFVGNAIRNTGYRSTEEALPDMEFEDSNNLMVSGSDGTDLPTAGEPAPLSFSTRSVNVSVGPETITLSNVATYSDVLMVRYQGSKDSGPVTDCFGDPVQSGVEETDDKGTADVSDDTQFFTHYAVDIIYARVAPAVADNRSRFRLHCRSERVINEGGVVSRVLSNSQTLVEDVTAFQLELGVDTSGDQIVDTYQTFTDTPASNRVRSLRVTLDVKGGRTLDMLETAGSATLSTAETLQRQFSQTFALRNLTR